VLSNKPRNGGDMAQGNAKMEITSLDYEKVKNFMTERKTQFITIGLNTHVIDNGDKSYSVILHKTKILTFYKNGKIGFYNGGYATKTTLGRMNKLLPDNVRIFQKDGKWYIRVGEKPLIPYEDNILVKPV
jgi:hypothetical protein